MKQQTEDTRTSRRILRDLMKDTLLNNLGTEIQDDNTWMYYTMDIEDTVDWITDHVEGLLKYDPEHTWEWQLNDNQPALMLSMPEPTKRMLRDYEEQRKKNKEEIRKSDTDGESGD